jgi:hypothetical protein
MNHGRREIVALLSTGTAVAIVLYALATNSGMTVSALRFDALFGADVLGLGLALATVLIG